MAYSVDLGRRVVNFVGSGGSKAQAQRMFKVSLWCVNDWCQRESLEASSPPGRKRQLDWKALAIDVRENRDKRLVDRAKEFNVWTNSIWYALTEMDIKYKKNSTLRRNKP